MSLPVEHQVDVAAGILRVNRWGKPSTQDEGSAFKERKKDPLVVRGIPVLVDCTKVEPADSIETIKYLADVTSRLAADLQCGPLAIVVTTDVEYGMARMYITYMESAHLNIKVFRSEKNAVEWLRKTANRTAVGGGAG